MQREPARHGVRSEKTRGENDEGIMRGPRWCNRWSRPPECLHICIGNEQRVSQAPGEDRLPAPTCGAGGLTHGLRSSRPAFWTDGVPESVTALTFRADPGCRECSCPHARILFLHHERDPDGNDSQNQTNQKPDPRIFPLKGGDRRCDDCAHDPENYEFSWWHCAPA